uniref:RING-type domain-containing protein n=1 Tax=Poecilia latipinna TaxID=48699 RepID=A0A3B3V9B0_9TELE
MASACSILYEEQVLCSICLGEFKEPVSTPCGHNFCKGCITQYWNSQDNAQCPLCKRRLGNKPELKVNTEFRDVVEHFNRMRVQGGPKIVAQPGEVPFGQIEETLRNEMKMLIQKVRSPDSCDAPTQSHAVENMSDNLLPELWSQPQDELMKIQQCNAVDVTLDPYTASNWLKVSGDGKRLTFCGHQQIFSSFFGRPFKYLPYVLAKEGFSSGRFYYEVQVSNCKRWLVGVVKEYINREINSIPTPEDGAWILNTPRNMFLNQIQTIGVFVDYEEAKVSFYDVEARSEICTFTEGISSIHRPKIYPVFGIYDYYYGDSHLFWC